LQEQQQQSVFWTNSDNKNKNLDVLNFILLLSVNMKKAKRMNMLVQYEIKVLLSILKGLSNILSL
jgi:hypothetical protein